MYESLGILIPVSLCVVLCMAGVIYWSIFSGQFENLDKNSTSILEDEDGSFSE
ncbi:MAG: cbb3-type cytochrome oxidase assembly protein CcoS [Alcaligenaceae bacterium]|nr:cbb3-type cytochrome oxidase assembly protein CcoS [Alcaligenaceae bacterium]